MTDTHPRPALRHITGGPEALFRVGDVSGDLQRVTMSMATGAWILQPDGRPAAGSIGVFVDDMFALAVVAHHPPDGWAVSTELTVDYCAPLPRDGSPLHAESETMSLDAAGGLGRGTVRDDSGAIVATGTQRLRFVTGLPAPSTPDITAHVDDTRLAAGSMLDLLDARFDEAGVLHLQAGPAHANPVGNLHGGILFAAAEAAAINAVNARAGSAEDLLETASINVVYLRPGPIGATVSFVPTVLHRGRSLAAVQVEALRPDGKACGLARVTAHRRGA